MNISKRDAKLLLILLGIVIFLVGYFAVYNRYNTRTDEVEAQTAALQPELEELRAHYTALPEYYAGIDAAREDIEELTENYPSDVRTEDAIMYAIELEEEVGIDITGISYDKSDALAVMQIVEGEPDSLTSHDTVAYSGTLSAVCTLSYSQLKDLIEHVRETEDRTTLEVLSISFDAADGALNGTVGVAKYFLYSGDDEFVPTDVPNVPLGTEDLFGTFRAEEEGDAEEGGLEIPD